MNLKGTDGFSLFESLVNRLGRPLLVFTPLLILNFVLPLFNLKSSHFELLNKANGVLLTIAFAFILVAFVRIGEDYVEHHYDLKKSNNLRERKIRTQLQFIRKLLIGIIITITACMVLLNFDSLRKLGTGLLTGVGVGGIIIGFAAQKSLANLLAGFQIAFTQPLRIDDILVVEGEWGRVEEITLTYVVLNIWDQRRLVLPINYFIEKPFQNWTRTTSEILGTVFMYLDYTVPIEPIRAEFRRILDTNELWDKRIGLIQVTNLSEKTMELRVLVSAENSSRAFDLRCYVREALISFVQNNYPQGLPRERMEWKGRAEANAGN